MTDAELRDYIEQILEIPASERFLGHFQAAVVAALLEVLQRLPQEDK